MALTNVRLVNEAFNFASADACGTSQVVSIALSAPGDNQPPGGGITTLIFNPTSDQSLDVEHRVVFTDAEGNERAVPIFVEAISSTLWELASGIDQAVNLKGVAASALQIAILAGVALTSAVSGQISVWRV